MMHLGLDVGEKRIGVALSDELNFMAHPVGFIHHRNDLQAISEIKKIAEENAVATIVVGLPKTLKNEIGTQAKKVLAFTEILRKSVSCDVVSWDERLSTAQAERALLEQDVSRARRRIKRDALAAEIILQNYLDCLKER